MDVKIKYSVYRKKIKFSLIFFCVLFLTNCKESDQSLSLSLQKRNDRVVSIDFYSKASSKNLHVYLDGYPKDPVLGDFKSNGFHHTFIPVIPFSNGQKYHIAFNDKVIGTFETGQQVNNSSPELIAIYPSGDTIPENTLKMYFVFSEAMQYIGNTLDFIQVFDLTNQQEIHPFLKLETELWNRDQTRLTLWFDPGRIKTDLIPNRTKGLPLEENHNYEIKIDQNWRSRQGIAMAASYSKKFYVSGADSKKPRPQNWEITLPKKGTQNRLSIDFREPLDAVLAMESITVMHKDQRLSGDFHLTHQETVLEFLPDEFWETGKYLVKIDPILEDLAGNNLIRLFDTDLSNQENQADDFSTEFSFLIQ